MRKAEIVFSLAMTILCVGYLYFVRQMDVGTVLEPGPGFMPAVVGIMALGTSFLIFLGSLKRPAGEKPLKEAPNEGKWRLAVLVAAIAAFIPLFNILGSIVSIFVIVFLLNRILGAKGWLQPLVLALICAAATWGVFVLALDVPLPKGILL
jgi:hypothetical protein